MTAEDVGHKVILLSGDKSLTGQSFDMSPIHQTVITPADNTEANKLVPYLSTELS